MSTLLFFIRGGPIQDTWHHFSRGPRGIMHNKKLWAHAYYTTTFTRWPMWALPKVSANLHMDSTDYITTYVLHYVLSCRSDEIGKTVVVPDSLLGEFTPRLESLLSLGL